MVKVTITTARELTKPEISAIEKKMLVKYPAGVNLKFLVQPEILGGIKLNMGAQEVDATVLASLLAVKQQLLKG